MFSRSSRTSRKVVVKKQPATVTIIKPEQSKEPAFDMKKARISVIKPETGLEIMVEKEEGED